jgi:HK97 family phage major capsid protein
MNEHETVFKESEMPHCLDEPEDETPGRKPNGARQRHELSPNGENIRQRNIMSFANMWSHQLGGTNGARTFGARAITEGISVDEFRQRLLAALPEAKPLFTDSGQMIGESERQFRARSGGYTVDGKYLGEFSVLKALREASEGRLSGIEKEFSDEFCRVNKRTREANSFTIPCNLPMRGTRVLNASSQTAGGFLVGTEVQGGMLIELLRNRLLVMQLGATNLSGLVGNVGIPKHATSGTAYWNAEQASTTDSDQSFGQLGLVPHTVTGRTKYTKQLLAQASIDVENFVRSDLLDTMAVARDLAYINGSGASGEPLGLMNISGLNTVTFGGAPTWSKCIDCQKELKIDNVAEARLAYISTPATEAKWQTTVKVTNQAVFLLEDGKVGGKPFFSTNQVPSDKVIFGNWSELIIADWDGIEIVVDPYTAAATRHAIITISQMTDCGVRHSVAFTVSTDSGAQ